MEARTNNSPILVTGGTGTLGRLVVARLVKAGRHVRVLSRGNDISGSLGRLETSEDRFGNAVTYSYYASTDNLYRATDPAGRYVEFTWDTAPTPDRLTSFTDWAYVSGGVVQTTATGSLRQYRLFYDTSGNLSGWADPVNTSGTCPTNGSHLACLTYTSGLLTSIARTQTVTTISGSPAALGTTTRSPITTTIAYTFSDVTTVKDAQEVFNGTTGTVFSHPAAGQTKVVHQGSPTTTTTYGLVSSTDAYGRNQSVWRLHSGANIERRTTYDATYPIEPASVTDNYGGSPARTFSYTYVASSLGLVSRLTEPLDASNNRITDYLYNSNNDVTPNATTNARTDLTIAYACDTAGNRVTSADPRRAILAATGSPGVSDYLTAWTFDPLNEQMTETTPTTPGTSGTHRTSSSTYDELGKVRSATDFGGLVSATEFDRAGRATQTFEDPDGAGSTAADVVSIRTFDAAGRTLTAKDQRQADDSSLGYDQSTYDDLGRLTVQSSAVGTSVATETDYDYDALDRQTTVITGVADASAQATVTTFDLGGRATKVDDEFTCTSTTFDYRGLEQTRVEGQTSGTCSGAGVRTVTSTYDGLGRLRTSTVTAGTGLNDKPVDQASDAAGNTLTSSSYAAATATTITVTNTVNPLDQVIAEVRSAGTWAKTNYDAAGNATDRCLWTSSPSEACKPAGSTFASPQPSSVTTTTYDARNSRIALVDAVANTTTTYDPDHNYQISAVYLPTGGTKEHQSLFGYDALHRLASVTHQLCSVVEHPCSGGNTLSTTGSDSYTYDDSDSRTRVNENNGNAGLDRYYCYDALNRLVSTRSASGCSTGLVEDYTYDDSGNRTKSGSVTLTYDGEGQLASCSSGCGTVAHDAAGNLQKLNGWFFEYDSEGRLIHACQSTSCAGSITKVEFAYDGSGHRTQITETTTGTLAKTWDFRYQGDAIVEEKLTDSAHPSGTVVRSYVVDESGSVVKMTIPSGETGAGTYLVTWNGHGDALALYQIDPTTGVLTLANSYTYTTWGAPTTATHNGIPDLGFRFLYVGQFERRRQRLHVRRRRPPYDPADERGHRLPALRVGQPRPPDDGPGPIRQQRARDLHVRPARPAADGRLRLEQPGPLPLRRIDDERRPADRRCVGLGPA